MSSAIGLSNFLPKHMDALEQTAKIKPMVNQIEIHPGLERSDVIEYCKERAILLEAWAPFAVGSTFNLRAEKFILIRELFQENKLEEARAIQKEANVIIRALCKVGVMQGEKAVMDALGFDQWLFYSQTIYE